MPGILFGLCVLQHGRPMADFLLKLENMEDKILWHNLSFEDAVKMLGSDLDKGLSEDDIGARQKRFGKNLLPEEKPPSNISLILNQLKNPMVYILLIAGVLTLALRSFIDTIIIFLVVFLNVSLGFIQERKAVVILNKLKKSAKHHAKVLRGGRHKIIDAEELVPGDIIVLNAGDKVPADARIIVSNGLEVNEMMLTGEWAASEKSEKTLSKETSLGDRDDLVYMGTVVEKGKAKAIVFATGLATEMGKVAEVIGKMKERKTPLQNKLSFFVKILSLIILIITLLIFTDGMLIGKEFIDIFTISVAMMVAAIPESLPAILTIVLAIGMQKILKRKGLVRKLVAAEALGSTSVICTDKTKTLTEGKMTVASILGADEIIGKGNRNHLLLLETAYLAGEAFIENPEEAMKDWVVRGLPTEKALLLAAIGAGVDVKQIAEDAVKVQEFPFDTKRKYSANIGKTKGGQLCAYIVGAPERILEAAGYLRVENGEESISSEDFNAVKDEIEDMAERGLRVVGVAYRKISKEKELNSFFEKLVFVGLVGLKDPIREDVKKTIEVCRRAGMKPIIVTGDHKLTARAVAGELGFSTGEENILEGKDLDSMSDEALLKVLGKIQIYARVEPIHKMRIVSALQAKGEVVAMTGDGVNDAPALKEADIGLALDSGTEVAKESSDLILLNDSFSVIVYAVEEGRRILDNIRKVIAYLLIGGFTEVMLIGLSIVFRLPLPVLAGQILWKNMIESTPPSVALAFEEKEKDIMKRPPESHKLPLLTAEMNVLIFVIGFLTNLILFGIFVWFLRIGMPLSVIRSAMFVGLSVDSFMFVFSCRNLRKNIWRYNPFGNKYVNISILVGTLMIILAIYLPFSQTILKTTALGFFEWSVLLLFGFLELILVELVKWFFIKYKKTN